MPLRRMASIARPHSLGTGFVMLPQPRFLVGGGAQGLDGITKAAQVAQRDPQGLRFALLHWLPVAPIPGHGFRSVRDPCVIVYENRRPIIRAHQQG